MRPCKRTKTRPGVSIPPDPSGQHQPITALPFLGCFRTGVVFQIKDLDSTAIRPRGGDKSYRGGWDLVLWFCSNDFSAFQTAALKPHRQRHPITAMPFLGRFDMGAVAKSKIWTSTATHAADELKSGTCTREICAPILRFSIPKNQ